MNDIQSLNRKYNTLESILTSSGKLNTAIIRRDFFEKLDIFKKIHEDTKELDEFKNVSFKDRVAYLRDGMKIEKCPFCGKNYINFKHSQKMYRLCNHHFNTDRMALSNALSVAKEYRRNKLLNSLKDKRTILDSELFSKKLENAFNSRKNCNAMTGNSHSYPPVTPPRIAIPSTSQSLPISSSHQPIPPTGPP